MRNLIRVSIAALALSAVALAQQAPAAPKAPKAPATPTPAAAPRPHVEKRVIVKDGKVYRSENGGPMVRVDRLNGRGFLGVHVVDLTDELRAYFHAEKGAGVLVGSVVDGSPAESAGLKVGDVITEVDDQKIDSPWDLTRAVRQKKAGESVKVEFVRSGVKQQAFAKVEERKREVVDLREIEELNVPIPPIPPIEFDIDEEALQEVNEYFSTPEWKMKVEKMSECGQLQEKMHKLELKMQELEKKLK